jgi:heat shock protein HtpX
MMLRSAGLATHIMNNHIKSVILLMGFPFLLLMMLAAFFTSLSALDQGSRGSDPGFWKTSYQSARAVHDMPGIVAGEMAAGRDPHHKAQARIDALNDARRRGDGKVDWGAALRDGGTGMLRYSPYAIGITAVWFTIAWFFHGSMISAATGAKPVTRQQMPKIYNMLENLCIARGIPMPKFEVVDSPALNAFAAGINEKTYKIVLTRGIIEALQDDELEAVIAHELSHILNRDVRLLIISVIFVGMISFFAELAFRALRYGLRPSYYRRGNSRQSGGTALVVLVAAVILAIGYMFALVIRFALSRKREFLADAGAVELTRNPEAMMRALMRISGQDKVRGMPDEVQQMCIENSARFLGVFATHPPIPARIAALSEMTQTPVPELPVSLRRPPSQPGERGTPAPAQGGNNQAATRGGNDTVLPQGGNHDAPHRPGRLFPATPATGTETAASGAASPGNPWTTGRK